VVDDLDEVSPRIVEVEPASERLYAELLQALTHGLLVVHDQPEVTCLIRCLTAAARERDELVAHVDEGHAPAPTAHLEWPKDRLPEAQRLVEISDLERDVIDSHQLWHCAPRLVAWWGSSRSRSRRAQRRRCSMTASARRTARRAAPCRPARRCG